MPSDGPIDAFRYLNELLSVPERHLARLGEDETLRARFRAYAADVGLEPVHATAILEGVEGPFTMDAFKTVLSSVAVACAVRLSREAEDRRTMAEVNLAIACSGMDRLAHSERRKPGSCS